jgi:FkbM family methyltransferase
MTTPIESMIDCSPAENGSGRSRLLAYASLSTSLRALYGSIQAVPLLGGLARNVVARAIPPGSRVWRQARAGFARGLWLNVDPRYESDYGHGHYEPILQQVLVDHLTSGGCFYDVGAHIGFFSLIAARLVGRSGAVFAFEADPQNAHRIEKHIARCQFSQIQVMPVAVWSGSGSLSFRRASKLSSRNTGSVVRASSETNASETIEVEAVSLDDFAEAHRPPTLIKIDVEGGETDVLRGADRLLARSRPEVVCEVHDQEAWSFVQSYLGQRRYLLRCLNREPDSRCHVLAQPR